MIHLTHLWSRRTATGWEAAVTLRDADIVDLLGKQVQPCVFLPEQRLGEALRDMFGGDRGLLTAEITNLGIVYEGLSERIVGHDFMIAWIPEEAY